MRSCLPQTAHSFSKTNLIHEKVVTKAAGSLQRIGCIGDCICGRFLVRDDKVCSLVELVLFDLGLLESFCVAVTEVFVVNSVTYMLSSRTYCSMDFCGRTIPSVLHLESVHKK